jgi:hypothetical protein
MTARCLDPTNQVLQAVRTARADHDPSARGSTRHSGRLANPGRRTGDGNDAVRQLTDHD